MIKSLLLNRYILLILIIGSVLCNCRAQNLIRNGSFENYTNIDCTYGGFINNNPPYNNVVDNWQCFNTPDYFNSYCNTNTGFSLPVNYYGYSNAYNGNSYTGFVPYSGTTTEIKEYIYQQLLQPLQAGKAYCLSFQISRADASRGAIKNIGAYFSNILPNIVSSAYINAMPQIENQNGFLLDTSNWIQLQGCFVANGGEQYITIGNFNSNANTDTMTTSSNYSVAANFPGWCYYYIDDIQLWDALTTDIESLDGTKFSVYPNPVNDVLHFEFASESDNRQVLIYDAIGNCIVNIDASSDKLTLATDELPSGVYFYTIMVNGKSIKNDKIIVIK